MRVLIFTCLLFVTSMAQTEYVKVSSAQGCPSDYRRIDSASVCESAASFFGRTFFGTDSSFFVPRGCYYWQPTDLVYLNTNNPEESDITHLSEFYCEKSPEQPELCATENHFWCVFPFVANGTEHNFCTSDGKDRAWCATTTNEEDQSVIEWDYCACVEDENPEVVHDHNHTDVFIALAECPSRFMFIYSIHECELAALYLREQGELDDTTATFRNVAYQPFGCYYDIESRELFFNKNGYLYADSLEQFVSICQGYSDAMLYEPLNDCECVDEGCQYNATSEIVSCFSGSGAKCDSWNIQAYIHEDAQGNIYVECEMTYDNPTITILHLNFTGTNMSITFTSYRMARFPIQMYVTAANISIADPPVEETWDQLIGMFTDREQIITVELPKEGFDFVPAYVRIASPRKVKCQESMEQYQYTNCGNFFAFMEFSRADQQIPTVQPSFTPTVQPSFKPTLPPEPNDCSSTEIKGASVHYLDFGKNQERDATINCIKSGYHSLLKEKKLECVDGYWRNTDDNKVVHDAYCGPYMPSSIRISDETALYIQLFGIEDVSVCGEVVYERVAEGKCQNYYFVDNSANPSICACLAPDSDAYNNNLLTLSPQELSSRYGESGYFLQISLCPTPDLPHRAQIDAESVVINDGVVGYPKGTFSIVCDEQYRYDSGTLKCDPNSISGNHFWTGNIGNCILLENCSLLLTLIFSVLFLYWGILWMLSCTVHRKTSKAHEMNNVLDLHPTLTSTRSIKIEHGCIGELFGGDTCSPSVLVPDLHGDVTTSSVRKWIIDMSYALQLTLIFNVADFITDLLFAQNMYDLHPCIAIISGISFMFSSVGLLLSLLVDYKSFQRNIAQEDRALVRLRWEILILTPLEDIVHGILGIYLFIHNIVDFITFLCIAFSGGMVIARIFKLTIADQGGMNTTKKDRVMDVELPTFGTAHDQDAENIVENETHILGGTIDTKTVVGGEKRVPSSMINWDNYSEGGEFVEESLESPKDNQESLKGASIDAE